LIATIHAKKNGWHKPVLRLVGHCVSAGWPDTAIYTLAPRITLKGYTVDQTRADLLPMIAGARRKRWAPTASQQYEIRNGEIWHTPQNRKLTNFSATIVADIRLDDGSGLARRRFFVEGSLGSPSAKNRSI
jgi:hypothetical protein